MCDFNFQNIIIALEAHMCLIFVALFKLVIEDFKHLSAIIINIFISLFGIYHVLVRWNLFVSIFKLHLDDLRLKYLLHILSILKVIVRTLNNSLPRNKKDTLLIRMREFVYNIRCTF